MTILPRSVLEVSLRLPLPWRECVDSPLFKIALFIGAVLGCFSLLFMAHARPGYFSNQEYIAGFVFLQVMLAAIWKFRRWFSVLLIVSFVMAGTGLPMGGGWIAGRWVVLAVGAVVGFFIFLRDRRYHFGAFHLLALFWPSWAGNVTSSADCCLAAKSR